MHGEDIGTTPVTPDANQCHGKCRLEQIVELLTVVLVVVVDEVDVVVDVYSAEKANDGGQFIGTAEPMTTKGVQWFTLQTPKKMFAAYRGTRRRSGRRGRCCGGRLSCRGRDANAQQGRCDKAGDA